MNVNRLINLRNSTELCSTLINCHSWGLLHPQGTCLTPPASADSTAHSLLLTWKTLWRPLKAENPPEMLLVWPRSRYLTAFSFKCPSVPKLTGRKD